MTKKTYKIFDVENLDITKSNRVALGNSFLEMVFLSDKHVIESEKTIRAVINDQPNISISSTWEDSPMTSIGQNISRFLQNPIIDSVAQQSVNYQKLTLTDEYSKKFYAGISDITFDISFRLYQDSFFKTTNPIIAFKNIINALLPKKTFNFSDAFSNIEDAFNLTSIAGSKAINSFSTAYNQLSSIIDSDGGKTTMNILNNLASDINSVMSSVAKNQALGNSYFLLKLGYDLLGFAYPMEVVCTNSSFEFSKQTWYNETQKKYQPYFIDFNMSFTTLCTPSLNTWKKYINGANDSSLSKIQEQNVKISQNPIKIDELNTNAINEAVLQELAHDDADGGGIHRGQPAEMVLRHLAMLQQRRQHGLLRRRQVAAVHHLLEIEGGALVGAADHVRRMRAEVVAGGLVGGQHLAARHRHAVCGTRRLEFVSLDVSRHAAMSMFSMIAPPESAAIRYLARRSSPTIR